MQLANQLPVLLYQLKLDFAVVITELGSRKKVSDARIFGHIGDIQGWIAAPNCVNINFTISMAMVVKLICSFAFAATQGTDHFPQMYFVA